MTTLQLSPVRDAAGPVLSPTFYLMIVVELLGSVAAHPTVQGTLVPFVYPPEVLHQQPAHEHDVASYQQLVVDVEDKLLL